MGVFERAMRRELRVLCKQTTGSGSRTTVKTLTALQAIPPDGCHKNDFYCHCRHTHRIDDLLAPCILTPGGVNATCSPDELGTFESSVIDLCKWYNSTGYLGYATCPMLLWE